MSIKSSEDFFISSLNIIPENVVLMDRQQEVVMANDAALFFLEMMGKLSEDAFFILDGQSNKIQFIKQDIEIGQDKLDVLCSELVHNMSKGIVEPIEFESVNSDGVNKCYSIVYEYIYDEEGVAIIVVGKIKDESEKKDLTEKAKFDPLTQCYSRNNLVEIICEKICSGKQSKAALAIVDITSFRDINEKKGYSYGDEVLKQLAEKIKVWVGRNGFVGRLSNDTFAVYIEDTKKRKDFEKSLGLLLENINGIYNVFGEELKVKISIGISYYEKECDSYSQWMKNAAKALYASKVTGGEKWQIYDESFETHDLAYIEKEKKTESIFGTEINYKLISEVFNILDKRESDAEAIDEALKYIGESYDVTKCFLAETFDQGATYEITYGWFNQHKENQYKLGDKLPGHVFKELFERTPSNGISVWHDTSSDQLGGDLGKIIKKLKTKTKMHVQIRRGEIVPLFMGAESFGETKNWTEEEGNTLYYLLKLFSIILQGKSLHEEVQSLNERGKIAAYIGENTDNFIYIVDPENFELLHMNKKALLMYGKQNESEWLKKKCYQVLHGKTEPCEFCTNKYTTENEFYEWNYYNPKFDKTYLFKDKLIPLNGKLVKLQVATDVTKLVTLEEELTNKLEEQTLLLNCIKMLHSNDSPDESINKILQTVCDFFGSSKGMLIRIIEDGRKAIKSHEWEDKASQKKKSTLDEFEITCVNKFVEKLRAKSAIMVDDVLELFSEGEEFGKNLKAHGINSAIVSPIFDMNGEGIGLCAIENPEKNLDKDWLLGSISVFLSDFIEKNKTVEYLNQLSFYDTLTGIKNRHSYRKELKRIEGENLSSLGVAYIDITGLSKINEAKGTRYGDELIKRMARLLTEIFDEKVFRVGGDEFVVLEENLDEVVFEGKIARLKDRVSQEEYLKVSIGFTWNMNLEDIEDDENTSSFNTLWGNSSYSTMLRKNLDNEIKSGKYKVYLQPQINLQTNMIDGAEALVRRLDGSGNLQYPPSFVPFYEKEGLVSKIDIFVFETLCQLIHKWERQDIIPNSFKLSVNCSRTTIMEKDIVKTLLAICNKHSVSTSKLIIEITETISQADDKVFSYIISSLKNAGFAVSLDDFGSGHANLFSLKLSDFDEIKIDMGLTSDLHLDNKSKILTKVALDLCEEFEGMVSVAEGIETVEQMNILKELNCKKGQGYYISRPISIEEFEEKYFDKKR